MPGHVFLVHGDLTQLSCDAWLVPSGDHPGPGFSWKHAVSRTPPAGTPAHWGRAAGRVLPWEPLHEGGPRPWVVLTVNWPGAPPEAFVEPAREFLAVASRSLGPPRCGR